MIDRSIYQISLTSYDMTWIIYAFFAIATSLFTAIVFCMAWQYFHSQEWRESLAGFIDRLLPFSVDYSTPHFDDESWETQFQRMSLEDIYNKAADENIQD